MRDSSTDIIKFDLRSLDMAEKKRQGLLPLFPFPEERADWDTNENVIIRGDNLVRLKLLQKNYSGKVKVIYIDPLITNAVQAFKIQGLTCFKEAR